MFIGFLAYTFLEVWGMIIQYVSNFVLFKYLSVQLANLFLES